ncbi:MAG: hypothetical protein ACD_80C00132G0001, partial [uncultured bacterium (gcode 4)]
MLGPERVERVSPARRENKRSGAPHLLRGTEQKPKKNKKTPDCSDIFHMYDLSVTFF